MSLKYFCFVLFFFNDGIKIFRITEAVMLFMFPLLLHRKLPRDKTSHLELPRHVISPSDTLTYPGRRCLENLWGSIRGPEHQPVSPPLAAGLLGLRGLEVNETRPNLASTALWVARNRSETPSLFRAPWTLQSASGTTAFLATPMSWRGERDDCQNLLYEGAIFL